jgi:DNA-binding transcriptional LysR family regulator
MQLSDRIGRRMKLQDLHILMTVVQAGSMGKAAERLNTLQPAISRSIADLEHAMGVRLLDRHRRGVEPTAYGRALLDSTAAAFDDLRQGVKNIEFLADPTAGEVRIGCSPLLTAHFVSRVVERLSRRYPRIVCHVVTGQSNTLGRELDERNVDFLVARKSGSLAGEQLDFEALYEDFHIVAAGAQNPLVRRRRIGLAGLLDQPWVLPPLDSGIGAIVIEAFRASGLDYPCAAAVGDAAVRMNLVASGRFVSIFPNSLLRFPTRHREIKVLPVELQGTHVPISIVTLKNRSLSPVARLFIEHAREVAKPLAKREK